jgi:ATP-dependent helicase HrpB
MIKLNSAILMNTCPIDEIIPAIKEALVSGNSLVVHAPPGAGKTTRVPLALLDIIPPEAGRIIMLEPRRLAAVSAARWMAGLIGEDVGKTVGYSIRFDSRTSASTRIEVVTEGILTRRIQSGPELQGVAALIFDEFHERSLNSDLALALSLDARRTLRNDLKIVVMSATLDCGQVAGLLGNAPVITSAGKEFEVRESYIDERNERPLSEKVVDAVRTALRDDMGDILVFLPGSGDIRACAESLRSAIGEKNQGMSVHALYGDLPFEEQQRAIMPSDKRKIVLATNIAETSLTIEGVRVVIDSGLSRRLQYDSSTGMNRLVTISASKASAMQRKGRAGRLGPGIIYRLYSQYYFHSMQQFSPPEILISDLSSLALELAAWGVKEPSVLSLPDAPLPASWSSAIRLLQELGAVDASGSITETGKAVVRLPLHPRLGKLLLKAGELGCPALGADISALLSERDIIRRRTDGQTAREPDADISARLELLYAWRRDKNKTAPGEADSSALFAVDKTSAQLMRLSRQDHAKTKLQSCDQETVSRLLLCAYPDRIAKRREGADGRFVLSQGRGVRFASVNKLGSSPFIIAANLDAGAKGEGIVHIAAPLTEDIIRQECANNIVSIRRVEWNKREGRIAATVEEKLGSIVLSDKPFVPSDDEAAPVLCEAVKSSLAELNISGEIRQFQGRVALMKTTFPQESWPDLSRERLLSRLQEWLPPWIKGSRTAQDIASLDILPAMKSMLTKDQKRLLDSKAPTHIVVPSGSRIALDYDSGALPALAVKLQEMFGLADTPTVADGKVKVLLKLLSPAQRPLQVTQDLKGFWNNGYQQVKKEMKGRYPKHPWPDDPWNATPTRKVKKRI